MTYPGYLLAGIRALWIFSGMILYMLIYGVYSIFIPHCKKRALILRQHYLKYWCIPALNIHIRLEGKETDKPCLYVCNHRSFADPIVICRYVHAFVIAKAEVKHYPIINLGAELTGVIWVDRSDKTSRNQARSLLVETIKSGFNVLVFPEGTVGTDPAPLPFKKGSFKEAFDNQIPVVPMAIEFRSAKDLWTIDKFVPQYLHQFSKWRTDVKFIIGSPIEAYDAEELHKEASAWVENKLESMQKGWSQAFSS